MTNENSTIMVKTSNNVYTQIKQKLKDNGYINIGLSSPLNQVNRLIKTPVKVNIR